MNSDNILNQNMKKTSTWRTLACFGIILSLVTVGLTSLMLKSSGSGGTDVDALQNRLVTIKSESEQKKESLDNFNLTVKKQIEQIKKDKSQSKEIENLQDEIARLKARINQQISTYDTEVTNLEKVKQALKNC